MDDNLLKQKFGITADVKICLQRVDEPSVEDHQVPTSRLKRKELILQDVHTDSRRVKKLTEHLKLNTKRLSALRKKSRSAHRKGTSGDVEPAVGYMEPIDEDFLSTGEKSQSLSCVDQNTNIRRIGRTRKRPACPCCIPGTQHPAVKSSTTPGQAERWSQKRGGRTKTVRKDVKTSGRMSCLTARNKHNVKTQEGPARDGLSRSSTDPNELNLHGEIRRLKELLKEKQTALQLMRNNTR